MFGSSGFINLWYWVLTVLIWTVVTHRTIGVPYDMILRAKRSPEVSKQVDFLAHVHSRRITALHRSAGTLFALFVGFMLSGMFVLGFMWRVEVATAAFLLLFPLTGIGYSTIQTSLSIQERDFRGATLIKILARRRFWHQVVAVVSMLFALVFAAATHSSFPG
ncbi:hypothetical protein [Amaricoccus tamworthensis]|uniref:hypothetical protein n=1 Tax=Amaricoccus tamworthensis TaxID=57002 RepID=UPI003C7A45CE